METANAAAEHSGGFVPEPLRALRPRQAPFWNSRRHCGARAKISDGKANRRTHRRRLGFYRSDIQFISGETPERKFPVKSDLMVRMRLLAAALCVCSIAASAQEDPLAWFPLQVGSRWVYKHEWKSGDRTRPDVDRWTTEETITGWTRIPEGLVVLRQVQQQGNSTGQAIKGRVMPRNGQLRALQQPSDAHPGYLVTRDREPYRVQGNCIYVIAGGWDSQAQQLRPAYREYLAKGALAPDFCFPLQMGRQWGNADIPWRVEPAREGAGFFLLPEYAGAVHIFSNHFGSGGWDDVWFQKGVGVVGEHYIHNGTYDEYTKKLLVFLR